MVEVAYRSTNCVHRAIFYSGFLHEPSPLNLFAFVVSALSVQKAIKTGSID